MKKKILFILCAIVLLIISIVGSYVIYVSCQFYRIEDDLELEIQNTVEDIVNINQELNFTSYNIGFGAYSNDYSFFLDEGYDENGKLQKGKHSRAYSEEAVLYNVTGATHIMKNLDSDFFAIQEVDYNSTRSYKTNQIEMIVSELANYSYTFAENFHSAYLFYPFHEPHGKNFAGLLTLSKYKIVNSIRKSYKITDAFIDKFFDLDRCFSVNEIAAANGKKLILINSHMSAYDEGGLIRNQQIEQLNAYMNSEYEKGNYIIVGGDFNHDLLTFNPDYTYNLENQPFSDVKKQKTPEWVSYMFESDGTSKIDSKFQIKAADDNPTVRGCDTGYIENYTYVNTVDGFIISDNVEFISVNTTKSNDDKTGMFAFADHQATTLKFKLK